jgi:hypothetical protein
MTIKDNLTRRLLLDYNLDESIGNFLIETLTLRHVHQYSKEANLDIASRLQRRFTLGSATKADLDETKLSTK